MTTIKISELVQATELSGSDVLPIVNGGSTKKVAVSSLIVLGDIPSLSSNWNSVYSTVKSLSDTWEESVFITPLQVASASWDSVYSTVKSLSDTWEESVLITPLQVASGSWDSVYSTTKSNSANWSNWSNVSASYALGSQYVKLSGDTMTGTLSVGVGGNLFSPSFATFVKNSSYATLSSTLTNNSGYFDSLGTFASPGGFIIKGHAPTYDNIIRNLPGYGTYGLWIQNANNMDPGSTFISDGRGAVTHAMSFRAGINNFTAGSDHNHVQWQGAPSNSTQAWQMTNGGSLSVYGYGSNTYSQRFLVHTLPQYQISTTIAATSGYFDTRNASLVTSTDRVSGVVILLDTTFGAGNYSLVTPGSVVGVTLNPGLVGLAAVIYNSQCTQVSSNGGSLSAFRFDFFIGNNNNWVPAEKGIQAVNLQSRANGGNPGVSLITSQIGTNPSTEYVGITGCYRNMNKHALARFTTASILTGFKPGSPLTLWIPTSMPSSSTIGTGFITSDKISTFAQGTFPTGVRTGYFDAFVINVSGAEMEFALCNLMDSYGFENRFWPISADGTAGWILYGGTQDTVHRPTFGTTGFYFEREPWYFASPFNYLSGGMVKCVGLGNSEVYGDFSYGLGYRGAVLGKKSGTFAGDYNAVYSDNSVALGGEGLISLSSTPYQAVVGKYNNPVNNALFVVGAGGSNTNRVNVLEVESSKISINGSISGNNLTTSFNTGSATGLYSFAEGSSNAFGDYSHAEGYANLATGQYGAHAEGSNSIASGTSSHAEGANSFASGSSSHAEGTGNYALGSSSHAEGQSNLASGNYSHAEGYANVASADYSHAEGNNNATGRKNNFLTYTAATKTFTFASTVSGNFSFVSTGTVLRGFENNVLGDIFTVIVASRNLSNGNIIATEDPIGGDSTTGYLFDNSGTGSHAEGINNTASGVYSHAEGLSNIASGLYSHAEGGGNLASGYGSHAEANGNTASGNYSHAEGGFNVTGRKNNFLTYTAATKTFTFASTVSGNFGLVSPGTILRGYETDTLDDFFTITVASRNLSNGNIIATEDTIGADSTNGYLIDGSGEYSHAEGNGNIASGLYSHAEGVSNTASGDGSHAEGATNIASGTYSHAEGATNIASGTYSHAEGANNIASGQLSHAAGQYAQAAHQRTWVWHGSTVSQSVCSTRTNQFMVSAAGGVYIPGNVGIGTDNNSNALTVNGSITAISLNVVSLSSRSIDLLHTPANDGTNPVFRIGELTSGSTTLSGFSGMFMSYNETSNIFGISAQFAPTPGVAAVSINRNANVGIGTDAPNNKLTVAGNISAYEVYSSLAVLSSSNSTGGLGPVYLRISNPSGDANNNGGAISIDQDSTTYGRIRSYYDNTYAGWRMSIGPSLTPSIYMVNTSGNVGINTAVPSEKLTVSGNISGNGNLTVTGNVFGGTNINLTNGSTYTIQLSDNGGTIASSNSTVGLTAVPSSSITYPAGFQTSIIQLSTARVSLSSNSVGLSINQANGYVRTTKQYSAATLLYTGTLGGWVLFGDVGA